MNLFLQIAQLRMFYFTKIYLSMMKGVKITSTHVLQHKTYTNIRHSAFDISSSQKQEQLHIAEIRSSPHHQNHHFHFAVSTHCSNLHLRSRCTTLCTVIPFGCTYSFFCRHFSPCIHKSDHPESLTPWDLHRR